MSVKSVCACEWVWARGVLSSFNSILLLYVQKEDKKKLYF